MEKQIPRRELLFAQGHRKEDPDTKVVCEQPVQNLQLLTIATAAEKDISVAKLESIFFFQPYERQ